MKVLEDSFYEYITPIVREKIWIEFVNLYIYGNWETFGTGVGILQRVQIYLDCLSYLKNLVRTILDINCIFDVILIFIVHLRYGYWFLNK